MVLEQVLGRSKSRVGFQVRFITKNVRLLLEYHVCLYINHACMHGNPFHGRNAAFAKRTSDCDLTRDVDSKHYTRQIKALRVISFF